MALNAFESSRVEYSKFGFDAQNNQNNEHTLSYYKQKFKLFLQTLPDYLSKIQAALTSKRYVMEFNIEDLNQIQAYQDLYTQILNNPIETYPILEDALNEFVQQKLVENNQFTYQLNLNSDIHFQLKLAYFNGQIQKLRELKHVNVNKLIVVQGIVVSSKKSQLKARKLVLVCSKCGYIKTIQQELGIGGSGIPRQCERNIKDQNNQNGCGDDPYVIDDNQSELYDQQMLKLQESPESIPTGEVPRSFQLVLDRYMANKIIPGNRITVVGIYSIVEKKSLTQQSSKSLKIPYIYGLGFQFESALSRRVDQILSEDDEENIKNLSKDPQVYQRIYKSIASSIYGHDDIKKAIACLLFGGSRKNLPDGSKLRGDINVLLIGDPSTAKSQFLKFVERTAPVAVYTSGKGSSAAGLTASIIKEPGTGEFSIEAGAMVLADGGIVCIDEFDKMSANDRVSIHEAMEQQTISIAKAGITTVLNTRTSVLAAANPIYGRYDDLKQVSDQIDLQTTILSRFDCIFIVQDNRTVEHDRMLAQHILNLHMGNINVEEQQNTNQVLDINFLKKYIYYAKKKYQPKLNNEAADALKNLYVKDRQRAKDTSTRSRQQRIPITVRQLEAIIRLSEALAKVELKDEVTIQHVNEAHRLFEVSTMNAISSNLDVRADIPADLIPKISKIEDTIKNIMTLGEKRSYQKLLEDLLNRFQDHYREIQLAIHNLIKRGDIKPLNGNKVLCRLK